MHDARILTAARAGQLTHGSIGAFLRDPSACVKLVTMYITDVLSAELNITLVLTEDLDPTIRAANGRALRGVHATDAAASVIVACILDAHIAYDDCAPFFANAIDRWEHIIITRNVRSTLSADVGHIALRRQIDWPIIHMPAIEHFVSVLMGDAAAGAARPIAAVPLDAADHAYNAAAHEEGESDESDQDDMADAAAGAVRAAGDDGPADDVDGPDDVQIPGYVARACAAITAYARRNRGRIPPQNGPRGCRLGRRAQYLRSSQDRLSPEDRALVSAIPGWSWDVHGDTFRARLAVFTEYTTYVAQHPGSPLPARYSRVCTWVVYIRDRRSRGILRPDFIRILNVTPGWFWP